MARPEATFEKQLIFSGLELTFLVSTRFGKRVYSTVDALITAW